jgi:hypothetical protein
MATIRNSEIMSHKFKVDKIYTQEYFPQQYDDDDNDDEDSNNNNNRAVGIRIYEYVR